MSVCRLAINSASFGLRKYELTCRCVSLQAFFVQSQLTTDRDQLGHVVQVPEMDPFKSGHCRGTWCFCDNGSSPNRPHCTTEWIPCCIVHHLNHMAWQPDHSNAVINWTSEDTSRKVIIILYRTPKPSASNNLFLFVARTDAKGTAF